MLILPVFLILADQIHFEDEREDEESSILPAYDEADELAPDCIKPSMACQPCLQNNLPSPGVWR